MRSARFAWSLNRVRGKVAWINRFLDQCMVRGLAWHTLRGYAFSMTHFIRWWVERHATEEVTA